MDCMAAAYCTGHSGESMGLWHIARLVLPSAAAYIDRQSQTGRGTNDCYPTIGWSWANSDTVSSDRQRRWSWKSGGLRCWKQRYRGWQRLLFPKRVAICLQIAPLACCFLQFGIRFSTQWKNIIICFMNTCISLGKRKLLSLRLESQPEDMPEAERLMHLRSFFPMEHPALIQVLNNLPSLQLHLDTQHRSSWWMRALEHSILAYTFVFNYLMFKLE